MNANSCGDDDFCAFYCDKAFEMALGSLPSSRSGGSSWVKGRWSPAAGHVYMLWFTGPLTWAKGVGSFQPGWSGGHAAVDVNSECLECVMQMPLGLNATYTQQCGVCHLWHLCYQSELCKGDAVATILRTCTSCLMPLSACHC